VKAIKVYSKTNYEHTDSICTLRDDRDEYRTGCERIDGKDIVGLTTVGIVLDCKVHDLV
jgi:hypothetical protein